VDYGGPSPNVGCTSPGNKVINEKSGVTSPGNGVTNKKSGVTYPGHGELGEAPP
jgi:hypothetical protein